jgi:Tfp pilus assembly protein PilO
MKGTDKAIVLGVVMTVVLAAFYFMVLSPKRDEASSLKKDIADLNSQIDQQKQVAAFAEDARRHFATYYGRLVVLGKAVPADADTASLLVQLNSIAGRTNVEFNGLQLSAEASDTASTPTPAPSGTSTTPTSTTGTSTTPTTAASAPTTTTPAPATEATAANMPLGASVGAAGLPTMPYDLTFKGKYFDVADFLKGVDDLVHPRGSSGLVAADGRLLTIDGFSLAPAANSMPSDPELEVKLSVTSYVTPSDQGLTAGATPGGPAPAVGQAQPASATVSP